MRIIKRTTIIDYYTSSAKSKIALEDWYSKTEDAEWDCFMDIKETFNSVDYVGNDRYVFNIKGNSFRLIAIILFIPKRVYIRFIGTHAEYTKLKDCSIL